MRIEFTHSFGLAVISFWLLGVRIFLSADGPLKIYRCLFPPSPETLERRRKIHQLQTQIRELQVQCERLHSPDTFVEYAKTKRRINQLQKTLDRTPAPQDSEPSQFVSKFLHFGVQALLVLFIVFAYWDRDKLLSIHGFSEHEIAVGSLGWSALLHLSMDGFREALQPIWKAFRGQRTASAKED